MINLGSSLPLARFCSMANRVQSCRSRVRKTQGELDQDGTHHCSKGTRISSNDCPLPELLTTPSRQYFYIAQVVYKIVIGFNKISILMLYLRIFTSKAFRIACYISLAIVAAFTIGSTMSTILQCIPINASWDKSIDNPTCTNSAVFWVAFAVINIVTDALILFLPVREVLHLHLHRREKFGLLALFSLGMLSVASPHFTHLQQVINQLTRSSTSVTVSSIIRITAVANSVDNRKDITCVPSPFPFPTLPFPLPLR